MGNLIGTIIQIGGLALQLIPPGKPPRTDYTPLREALDKFTIEIPPSNYSVSAPLSAEVPEIGMTILDAEGQPVYGPEGKEVSTSCISCSRSHLITAAGALDEALRFAREGGIMHPEAVKRISLAEREINIMERIDLSPESIEKSPEQDQDLARQLVPRVRVLRQNIGQIGSPLQLEQVAAQANELATAFQKVHMASKVEVLESPSSVPELPAAEPNNEEVVRMEERLKELQAQGYDLNPVIELARKVQSGELSKEDAKKAVRELLQKRKEVASA